MANPRLNGRAIAMSMGKVLGGGSSINVMVWSRGHKADWDYFAAEAGDDGWSYQSVLQIYLRIEDWHGAADAPKAVAEYYAAQECAKRLARDKKNRKGT
jgi:choline dehydrogenase